MRRRACWSSIKGRQPEQSRREQEEFEDARVDDILARLHDSSLADLSPEEVAVLQRASKRYKQRLRPMDGVVIVGRGVAHHLLLRRSSDNRRNPSDRRYEPEYPALAWSGNRPSCRSSHGFS